MNTKAKITIAVVGVVGVVALTTLFLDSESNSNQIAPPKFTKKFDRKFSQSTIKFGKKFNQSFDGKNVFTVKQTLSNAAMITYQEGVVARAKYQIAPISESKKTITFTSHVVNINGESATITVIDDFSNFGEWAEYIKTNQPKEVIIGWGHINNIDLADIGKYDDVAKEISLYVKMIRDLSPDTFIWITVCKYTPTYLAWKKHVENLGDGILLWGILYFPAPINFPKEFSKPVMLAFIGSQIKVKNFEQKIDSNRVKAAQAGFSGFIWVQYQ